MAGRTHAHLILYTTLGVAILYLMERRAGVSQTIPLPGVVLLCKNVAFFLQSEFNMLHQNNPAFLLQEEAACMF